MASASDTLLQVHNGMLIEQLEDGRYVPFFLKVRDSDIIWNDKTPETIDKAIGLFNEKTSYQPTTYIQSEINGWICKFNSDLSCEFIKEVYITKDFTLSKFNTMLSGTIALPARIDADRGFFPSIVANCTENELATANISIVKNMTSNTTLDPLTGIISVVDSYVDSFTINLNNPFYRFHENFASMPQYTDSFFYVTIRGNLHNTQKEATYASE